MWFGISALHVGQAGARGVGEMSRSPSLCSLLEKAGIRPYTSAGNGLSTSCSAGPPAPGPRAVPDAQLTALSSEGHFSLGFCHDLLLHTNA